MNLNIRLSAAACSVLLTFAAGFHAGVTYAGKPTPPQQERPVCLAQWQIAMTSTERLAS